MEGRLHFTATDTIRRNEIRRRSGLSPNPEVDCVASTVAYSPSWRAAHQIQPVQSLPEDDPHRLRSADDTFSAKNRNVDEVYLASPTVKLVRSRGSDSEGSWVQHTISDKNDLAYLRVEAPLPPLPEEAIWENSLQTGDEDPLSPILLTPRPGGPSRLLSQDSQVSQRSRISLFPRLPTPDFTVLNRNPLKRIMSSRFDFLRARTPSEASLAPSLRSNDAHLGLGTAIDNAKNTVDKPPIAPVPPKSPPSPSHRVNSFGNNTQSNESCGTLADDEFHSAFMSAAPPRFTRKFPSLTSVSSRQGYVIKSDICEGMMGLESGNTMSFESMETWTGYKWCLLVTVLMVFGYSIVGLVYSILTWFGTHIHADVIWVADNDILIFITLASTLLLLTGLVGLSGTLLNSRPILAFYALLLWPSFVSMLLVGYTSYKREAFSLDRKLNMAWSQWYDDLGRLLIQQSLHCCGFYNPLHEATFSKNCYPRTQLPGCKGKLYRFEKENLRLFWRVSFSLVPLHILNITVSLLCSNHVDRRFGKGLTPRAYRLSMADVRANADAVLAQFAGTKLPSEPSRSFSHVTDREDRPATSRLQYGQGRAYENIGHNFMRG